MPVTWTSPGNCSDASRQVAHAVSLAALLSSSRSPRPRALPAVASHAIGYADPGPAAHSHGIGAYRGRWSRAGLRGNDHAGVLVRERTGVLFAF